MKDLEEASHILGIKLFRDCQKRMLGLSQTSYIDEILTKFSMQDSKIGFVPFRVRSSLLTNQWPKTPAEIEKMIEISYASAVESLMYAMLCTRPDICFALAWLGDTSQTLAKNTGQQLSIYSNIFEE